MDKKEEKGKKENNLLFEKKFAFDVWDDATVKKCFDFCEGYKEFLSECKTERKTVAYAEKKAKEAGFERLEHIGQSVKTGFNRPLYSINRGRAIILARPGRRPLAEGLRFVMAHGDSNHLDLKLMPLYENEHIAFLKTQYYGGIKKYHWPTIPLSMCGTFSKQDGTAAEVEIGEKENDPIFMITDLLPHLSKQQDEKKMSEGIPAESLNVVVGGLAQKKSENSKDEKDLVKKRILSILNKKYGIAEEDFVSADLQFVPQGAAKNLGFDESFIAGYAHDDRACVYTALEAMFAVKNPEYASICLIVDREEIGSVGNTGARSSFILDFISEIVAMDFGNHNENLVRDALSRSKAISADTAPAYDPDYAEVHDSMNAPRLGAGVIIEKFTSTYGKYSTNEATGEYTAFIRKILNDNGINWQSGGMGKVDFDRGGATISCFLAELNMDIIDIGISLLSLHAPFEIASKADIYSAYLAYKAFYES